MTYEYSTITVMSLINTFIRSLSKNVSRNKYAKYSIEGVVMSERLFKNRFIVKIRCKDKMSLLVFTIIHIKFIALMH